MNISFDKQNLPTTVGMIASVAILLGSLIFAVLPKPDVAAQIQKLKQDAEKAEFEGKKLRLATEAKNKISLAQTWSGTGNEIGPAAYASLYKIATALNVKIVNFRPQREINSGDVTQIPITVNVTGSYSNVLEFVRKIETTPTKLAVELLQLGGSDETTDNVTGTVGVEAYVLNVQPDAPAASTSTKPSTTAKEKSPTASAKGPGTVISAKVMPKTEKKNGK